MPRHLHHHERKRSIRDKVAWLAEVAATNDCALRVGVNCGSVAPEYQERFPDDSIAAMVECALDHCGLLDDAGFENYVVSLKDSDPQKVIDANRRFAAQRPDVPIHLGVTEAGLLPEGEIKTRIAFEQLLSRGIGDTIRVSLTLPNERKHEEVHVGRAIIKDVHEGRFRSVPSLRGLNIIACPSCSRVENGRFVELAERVRELTEYAKDQQLQQAAESASETEYRLFGQITGALMEARDRCYTGADLIDPLDWNRRMWTTLSTDCAVEGNGLPDKLRAGIISLSIFVNKHTSLVMRGEAEIDDLININKQIMEGSANERQRRS